MQGTHRWKEKCWPSAEHIDHGPPALLNDLKLHVVEIVQNFGPDHRLGGAIGHDPTIAHGNDPVAVTCREIQVMQHDDNGLVMFLDGATQQMHHANRMADVQTVQRFVEQRVTGVLGQNHGDKGALALAARQFIQKAVLLRLQPTSAMAWSMWRWSWSVSRPFE